MRKTRLLQKGRTDWIDDLAKNPSKLLGGGLPLLNLSKSIGNSALESILGGPQQKENTDAVKESTEQPNLRSIAFNHPFASEPNGLSESY